MVDESPVATKCAMYSHAKNLDVEVLRAFAVVSVVIGHAGALFVWGSPAMNWLAQHFGLWAGVDLFFAISGFVITKGLYDQLSRADTKSERTRVLIAFWTRRVYRILPSAVLWLSIGLLLTVLFNRSGTFGGLRGNLTDAIASLLQIADVHYYQCLTLHIDTCGSTRVFGPYWSLSLEEKFYLVLPIAIIFLGGRLRVAMLIAIAVQVLMPRPILGLAWYLRTDAFLIGSLLALESGSVIHQEVRPTVLNAKFGKMIPWAAYALLLITAAPFQIVPIYLGIVAILSGILVWIASYGSGYVVGRGLFRTALAWIGTRSYAIYLIHMPSFYVTREFWYRMSGPDVHFDGTYTLRFIVTAIGLIVVFAELNYRFIETPIRRLGARRSASILARAESHHVAQNV
ncbi:acyltransferase [Paraburkholderia sp. Ac-20347]|uniref:acyltransferase family protein n=1 Tax=Paraburkholderia sp. Ac-20347 TaxID=2703892 RepID=UPI00197DA580|nr:acyltransferase [Paraburkholderia sp. Ac-20347]MBN3811709.1 acyltransferase [Paraburkholderia sp. Ac-20347]